MFCSGSILPGTDVPFSVVMSLAVEYVVVVDPAAFLSDEPEPPHPAINTVMAMIAPMPLMVRGRVHVIS